MTYSISINDPSGEKVNDMLDYCHSNKLSLSTFDNIDVSDFSGRYDMMATFCFTEEVDALIFKLKFI